LSFFVVFVTLCIRISGFLAVRMHFFLAFSFFAPWACWFFLIWASASLVFWLCGCTFFLSYFLGLIVSPDLRIRIPPVSTFEDALFLICFLPPELVSRFCASASQLLCLCGCTFFLSYFLGLIVSSDLRIRIPPINTFVDALFLIYFLPPELV